MTGAQEPRIRVEPERIGTDGGDAADLMAAYAYRLDPWQRSVCDCWLGLYPAGGYSVTSAGLSTPRQNGKNGCLEARELFGMVIGGERILHTAHQVRTAKKSFRRLERIFTNRRHPDICSLVRTIRYTNGEEAIELTGGGSIEFSARSRQAARGFDGISLIVFDEAQELTDDQLEAILATLSASATGNRQIIYTGTPPYPGCPGTIFRAWHEWSVDARSAEDIDVRDRRLWYQANPALGLRLTEDFTAEELRTMSADGFARERLGWWSPILAEAADRAVDPAAWEACASDEPKPEGKTAYGVKFAADGSEVCLCGAVIPKEGPARIALIDRRPMGLGVRWLSDWLCERYTRASCVVIDGRNGADLLTERVREVWKARNSVVRAGVKDVIAAASMLTDELTEKTVSWNRIQDALRDSALTAVKRPLGGGWAFGGEDPGPIEAAALALWGARTTKRDPARKMRIG